MAYATIVLKNPYTGAIKQAPVGYSWTTLFFNFMPALIRGDFKWAVVMLLLCVPTLAISVIVFSFIYNKIYLKELIGAGFKVQSATTDIGYLGTKLGMQIPMLEGGDVSVASSPSQRLDIDNSYLHVKPPTKLKWAVVCVVLVALGVIGALTEQKDEPDTHLKGYTLNAKETVVLNALLKNEAIVFAEGGDSVLLSDLPKVSASEVARVYNGNQVAGDQTYLNKTLFVMGVIGSIGSGLGNEPYVVLRAGNQFTDPQLHFDGDTKRIASLKQGQKIAAICKGNGVMIGTPIFKDCQFADAYASEQMKKVNTQISDFLEGSAAKNDNVALMAVMTITAARMMPDTSPCFTDEAQCEGEFNKLGNQVKSNMSTVITELTTLGITIPPAIIKKANSTKPN